jgi:hypothetical protein
VARETFRGRGEGGGKINFPYNPGLQLYPIHLDDERQVVVRLRRVEEIRIACRCLYTSQLNRERCCRCVLELVRCEVKCDGPVIDLACPGLWDGPLGVRIAAEYGPVYVVPVPILSALPNVEVDTFGEVI